MAFRSSASFWQRPSNGRRIGTSGHPAYPDQVSTSQQQPPRTYQVRTYGCQMNVHDSERLAGLLEASGYVKADADELADVVVFNTCAVRENADNKLYGNLGSCTRRSAEAGACRSPSAAASRRRTAARSCAERRGSTSCSAPTTWGRCPSCSSELGSPTKRRSRSSSRSTSSRRRCRRGASRSTRRGFAYQRRVQQHVHVLHRAELARQREGPPARATFSLEIETLVDDGVIEVTLLGQNVNSYGVEFGDRLAFSKAAACVRFDRRS